MFPYHLSPFIFTELYLPPDMRVAIVKMKAILFVHRTLLADVFKIKTSACFSRLKRFYIQDVDVELS